MSNPFNPACPQCNGEWKVVGSNDNGDVFGCSNGCGLLHDEHTSWWIYKKLGDKRLHWHEEREVCYIDIFHEFERITYYTCYYPFDITEEQLNIYLTFS